jgi:hypothetical protein
VKPHGKAEPRFDIDLAYGRQAELQIGDFLTWIAEGNGQVEVKRKRYLDLEFYVETHCDKGRTGIYQPSGISITTAAAWAFVIADTGIAVLIPTDELRVMLDDVGVCDREERDGSCPTRGRLVNLSYLLYRHQQRSEKKNTIVPEPALTAKDIRWN